MPFRQKMSGSKQNPDMATILVTDAGLGSAISIIRSLGRRGWRVIAADCHPNSPGFRSRYVRERLLYPSPETAPRECAAALLQAARQRKVELIIPVTDAVILPLSEARSQFEGVCKLALSEPTALEVVANKTKTIELAKRLGVPVPQTCLVFTVQEALNNASALGWPVVLKPQVSRLYRERLSIESLEVCYANDPHQLLEQMQQFEGRCPVLMQEYYRGTGYGVELLMYEGRPLAAFQHKRLREVPINGGASAFRQSVPLDPELYSHAVRLLQELNWTGLAMVEFKMGKDGAKLMEINGRIWGSLPLAVHSGMDFPARLAEIYLCGHPEPGMAPDTSYTVGVKASNLFLELVWIAKVMLGQNRYPFLAMPKRRQAFAALLQILSPVHKFDIMSVRDPRPGLADLLKIADRFASKFRATI